MKLHEITDFQHLANRQHEAIYKIKRGKIKIPWQFNYLLQADNITGTFRFIYKYTPEKPVTVTYWTDMEWRVHVGDSSPSIKQLYDYLDGDLPYKQDDDYIRRYNPAFDTFGKCLKLFLSQDWKKMKLTWPTWVKRGLNFTWDTASPQHSFLQQELSDLYYKLSLKVISENAETPPQFWQQYCSRI